MNTEFVWLNGKLVQACDVPFPEDARDELTKEVELYPPYFASKIKNATVRSFASFIEVFAKHQRCRHARAVQQTKKSKYVNTQPKRIVNKEQ